MSAICSKNKDLFMTTFFIGLFGGNCSESDEIDAKDCSGIKKNSRSVVEVNDITVFSTKIVILA
jgi:hypothetical protein